MNLLLNASQERSLSFVRSSLMYSIRVDLTHLPMVHDDAKECLAFAGRTRTMPAVGRFLHDDGGNELPEWFHEVATGSLLASSHRSQRLISEAQRIGACLRKSGIDHAFRKGVVVSSLYRELGARPFSDIDLLVEPKDEKAIASFLHGLGYTRLVLPRDERLRLRVGAGYLGEFVLGDTDVSVDLSSTIAPPRLTRTPAGISLSALRKGAFIDQSGDLGTLSSDWLLADALINFFIGSTTVYYVRQNRFQRLIPYSDICVLKKMVSPDWLDKVADILGDTLAIEVSQYADRAIAAVFGPFDDGPGTYSTLTDPTLNAIGQLEYPEPLYWTTPLVHRLFIDNPLTVRPPL